MSIYCGRKFSAQDIQTIHEPMAQNPALQRAPMSRQLCQLWGWLKPNGELKDMSCRVALLRMQADGLITLPPSRLGGVHTQPSRTSHRQRPQTRSQHCCNPCTNSTP